ncbi:MAG TPA: hypothetical protein VN677_02445 [Gemmatimonadaceae bacterium]|nr:hypothetical protein [Gemmatimonadaceae bacterium]
MFLELVGALRCVRPHEATWLVASAYRMEQRDIVSGELGCPVCDARYAIEYGVADFRDGRRGITPAAADDGGELALRVAALLDLTTPGGVIVLVGRWAAAAHAMGELTEHVHVLGLDAPSDIESGNGVSLLLTAGHLPLRPFTVRGVALDAAHASADCLAAAVAALQPNGRLLAPVESSRPAGVEELARDENHWLAARTHVTTVPLLRRDA